MAEYFLDKFARENNRPVLDLSDDARAALMTGSGACVFGIFDDPTAADKCAREIGREEFTVFTARATGDVV